MQPPGLKAPINSHFKGEQIHKFKVVSWPIGSEFFSPTLQSYPNAESSLP